MGALCPTWVCDYARNQGYVKCQDDGREGVIAFDRADHTGARQLVRVWYRTGTVGTYLSHPRQVTDLFVDEYSVSCINLNPLPYSWFECPRVLLK